MMLTIAAVNANDFIAVINQAMNAVPLLAKLMFFLGLAYLVWDAIKTKMKWSRMELLILVAALSVAGFGIK